jgi:hypothetical protein
VAGYAERFADQQVRLPVYRKPDTKRKTGGRIAGRQQFTAHEIKLMRRKFARSGMSYREMSVEYGISYQSIRKILIGEAYSWVD